MNVKKAINDVYIYILLRDERYKVTILGKLLTRISRNGRGLLPNNAWRECGKINCYGYNIFQPRFNGRKVDIKVHRVVYAKFKGELCQDKVVNHIDGNRLNNYPENLELIGWNENNAHKLEMMKRRK